MKLLKLGLAAALLVSTLVFGTDNSANAQVVLRTPGGVIVNRGRIYRNPSLYGLRRRYFMYRTVPTWQLHRWHHLHGIY